MTFVARDWPGPVLLRFTRAITDVESEKIDRCLNACWDLETALMPSFLTTAGCDAIRSADISPTRAMLDRRTERHFLRLIMRNTNSDMIPDEPDDILDEEEVPILDRWTERAADLWTLGDEVERSTPAEIEFAPWHDGELGIDRTDSKEQLHGYTDGSRRTTAAFGWTLLRFNSKGKQDEIA
jgi:hypothetical protein